MERKKINEIFYSLQGEGAFSGVPAIFVRFSGCNLKCSFCDTKHKEGRYLTNAEIVQEVAQFPARHVVLTGGEPSLFIDAELVDELHAIGKFVAIETNGTRELPANIDWITLSPKSYFFPKQANAEIKISRCDELKVLFLYQSDFEHYLQFPAKHYFLQPCDMGNVVRNQELQAALIEYLLAHPRWRLSLQLHKLLGVR